MKYFSVMVMMAILTGCQGMIGNMVNAPLLGLERHNQNQCLTQPLKTKSGITLPVGTRGTMNMTKSGQATFIVDTPNKPIFYDITGQSWFMKSCD